MVAFSFSLGKHQQNWSYTDLLKIFENGCKNKEKYHYTTGKSKFEKTEQHKIEHTELI